MKVGIFLTFVIYSVAYGHCTTAKQSIQYHFSCANTSWLLLQSKLEIHLDHLRTTCCFT